jgi:hypothetical protein
MTDLGTRTRTLATFFRSVDVLEVGVPSWIIQDQAETEHNQIIKFFYLPLKYKL